MEEELGEFIVLKPGVIAYPTSISKRWTINNTKILIDLYGKYKKQVGTLQVRSIKHMWTLIAQEISNSSNIRVTENQCENRWRVLERNFKKYIENQNATGRGKKYFEFAEEMDMILAKKKNIVPDILLESSTISIPNVDTENVASCSASKEVDGNRNVRNRKKRTGTMELMRLDRQSYFEKRIKIEEEKLMEFKTRTNILKGKNDKLKEYVDVVKKSKCSCLHSDGLVTDLLSD
ncbi:hypothetical protein ABEB36_015055 [Hypothenemus hampei]|uniref:Myb-like domain-containing protein n=1 Tax=Hypothenemus hampei TaxID=57062 RepID=A0ABD1E098_HYPHA